jgi:small nuclear ribonucleoprotein (snRNP)-like protein
MDDQPDTGDFGRACVDPVGTTVGMGSAGLWAQFEVAALNVGNAAYIFNDTGNNRVWRVTLSNGTTLQGSSLSFSIAPNVSLISVVQQAISADADADGDVDLNDYSTLIACAKESRPAAEGVCARLDLAQDGVIDLDDLVEFVPLLTGPSGSTKAPGHDKAEIAGERVVEAIALQKTADDCHPSEKRP